MEIFSGLRIAYLSGVLAEDALTAKPFNYTITNVQSLEVSTRTTKEHTPVFGFIGLSIMTLTRLALYIF